MVHKVIVPEADYALLAGKQKFSCCNIVVFTIIFLLGFTAIGILTYNFFKTAIAEEKLVNNVKVPSWMHWMWNHNSTNATAFKSTLKPIKEHYVVCYYTFEDNLSTTKLLPNNLDPHLCTHIIIGFASVVNCTLNIGKNVTPYHQVVALKKIAPTLKVMVSVGGAENDEGFAEMVSNHSNRKMFIRSVLNVTKDLNLDGLDLDWEFPGWAQKADRQKIQFIQLVYELRKEFDHSGRKLTLSAAVAAPQAIIDQSYEVPSLAEHIDFINLMSYDYHFYIWYYPVTDLNSPLYSRALETGYLTSLNVNFSANYWVLKGMPREKIVIGIPTYGHSYKLYNPANHKVQAPAKSVGETGELGFVKYSDVCNFLKNGALKVFLNDSHVPYSYKNSEWISYDDITSVKQKALWIKANQFKGAMIYKLNTDDWNSTCSPNHGFPLTNTVKKILLTN
ncbi:chitinase-3-like protein 2 isoform X1 [Trichogramma pretiosum]|uniref:chitinase-3-like protein 2 isoform X1 n=1 Tax=Trichogramma pretiosum TaxID=7493 RepID=UPI0006C9792F|nr:chitinase-3-like protein 2 isoform X1 [Trichogramma pretiosum]XP_014223100.1 chitinase-3-like protein 2 isoform X1 [Trichogramma pretiosum]XP_023317574.1 chitinase-3-like protein 2 isoform X1 [Trichogramma pretiosum]